MLARHGLRFFIAVLLVAACAVNSAFAREDKIDHPNPDRTWGRTVGGMFTSGKSVAVVIGISKYIGEQNDGYPPLITAVNDADKMVKFLRDDAGFDTIYVLTDEDATKQKIDHFMTDEIPLVVGQFDRFLFYWSGHGDQMLTADKRAVGFLPLADSKRRFFSSMVNMDDIVRWNSYLYAQQALFVLDVCLSGLAGLEEKGIRDTQLEQLSQPSRQLVTAGTDQENVISGDRWTGSLFTDSFIEGAKGAAQRSLGIVGLYGLIDYIQERVTIEKEQAHWTKSLTPQIRKLSAGNGSFFFTPKTGAVSPNRPTTKISAQVSESKGSETAMVEPLIAALNAAPDDWSRGTIASALGHVGEKAAPAVEALIVALKATQDDATRGTIASALGQIGEKAAPAVEALIVALKATKDDATRVRIASALGHIGEKAAPAVEPLIAALKATQDDATRGTIASALGQIGEKAAPAVDPLIAALNATQDDATRVRIAKALDEIGEKAALMAMIESISASIKDLARSQEASAQNEQLTLLMMMMQKQNQQAERDKTPLDAAKTRHDIVMGIAGNIR